MLKKFFKSFLPSRKAAPSKPRRQLLKHQGDHYNLKEILTKINAQYFENKLNLPITWFGNKNRWPKTRIILGSYNQQNGLIKINRLLDQAHVPDHFVSFIVYHEMLHHVLPPLQRKSRGRRIHHRAFVEREKQFKDYALAKQFKNNLKNEMFKNITNI